MKLSLWDEYHLYGRNPLVIDCTNAAFNHPLQMVFNNIDFDGINGYFLRNDCGSGVDTAL